MTTRVTQKSVPLSPEEKAERFLRYLEAGNPFMASEYKLNIYHSLSTLPWKKMLGIMNRFAKRVEQAEKGLPQRMAEFEKNIKELHGRLAKRRVRELTA